LNSENKWDLVITPKNNIFSFNFKEIWRYRDLLFLFVKRDFVATYKQTILGPLWFLLQPLMTSLMFVLIFGKVAKLPTNNIPNLLFYLSGLVIWNYFSECLMKTSDFLVTNQHIFGKVYFPRLILPLSIVISNLLKFFIQLALLIGVLFYYLDDPYVTPQLSLLLIPFYILLMMGIGLSLGMIFSSLTTKYKDLAFLLQFGVQLLLYATPVIYPLSIVPENYRAILNLNPITPVVESFRYAFIGSGDLSVNGLIYSFCFMVVTFTLGVFVFNKVEKQFMDTV
jgi:lipopolysaccharide transport system permease protein